MNPMKHSLIAALGICAVTLPLRAEILTFELSPAGTSPAVGLSPANEVPVATGTGSGGKLFPGITFNTDTNLLSVTIGYGSYFGFTDLTGAATMAHIHGPAPVTAAAGVIHDFFAAGQHLFAPVPTTGGIIVGGVTLTAAQKTDLINGLDYVNIHTVANPNGEVRAQLIQVVNTPPIVDCPEPTTVECTGHEGTSVEVLVGVTDANGDQLTVNWAIDGVSQTQIIVPSGGATTAAEVQLVGVFGMGEHTVTLSVSDGVADPVSCEFTVTVVDTTPPVITSVVPSPSKLWPPNHKMRDVIVNATATDICGQVTTRIVEVTSNEPVNGKGDGNTGVDWSITGDHKVKLRAERAGPGSGRIYTITVEATDEAGNTSTKTTVVTVPHSNGGR
jgi:hypothetical protein